MSLARTHHGQERGKAESAEYCSVWARDLPDIFATTSLVDLLLTSPVLSSGCLADSATYEQGSTSFFFLDILVTKLVTNGLCACNSDIFDTGMLLPSLLPDSYDAKVEKKLRSIYKRVGEETLLTGNISHSTFKRE